MHGQPSLKTQVVPYSSHGTAAGNDLLHVASRQGGKTLPSAQHSHPVPFAHPLKRDRAQLGFKTMMGQKGLGGWHALSQKEMWKKSIVRHDSRWAFRQYARSITHLNHSPIQTIPKTLHFVWIGPKQFPEESIANLISWKTHHPTWQMFFWTDDKERPLPIEGMKRRLLEELDLGPLQPFFEASVNWGEKSDLVRYMVIYEEGGIYTDHDVECVRPLDPLSSHYDFVAGFAPLHFYTFSLNSPFVPNNGIIISRPHHPILEKTISRLSARWEMLNMKTVGDDRRSIVRGVVSRTFDPFAYCASHYIDSDCYRNILLPASYLHSANCFKKKTFDELLDHGHVYAIHRLNAAWAPPPKKEKA